LVIEGGFYLDRRQPDGDEEEMAIFQQLLNLATMLY
jgi:hypothetical protein